jgi:hypothetical protein
MRKAFVTIPLVAGLAAPVVLVGPAQAVDFPRKAVQNAIERQIKEVIGQPATVKCPARKTWKKGAVFYCSAKPTNGAAGYRVEVTLRTPKNWKFDWVQAG